MIKRPELIKWPELVKVLCIFIIERKLEPKFFFHFSEQPLRFIVVLSQYNAFFRPKVPLVVS